MSRYFAILTAKRSAGVTLEKSLSVGVKTCVFALGELETKLSCIVCNGIPPIIDNLLGNFPHCYKRFISGAFRVFLSCLESDASKPTAASACIPPAAESIIPADNRRRIYGRNFGNSDLNTGLGQDFVVGIISG